MEQFNHIKPYDTDAQVKSYQLLASGLVTLLYLFASRHAHPYHMGITFEGCYVQGQADFFHRNNQDTGSLKEQQTDLNQGAS